MADPFLCFGIHGALLSGKVAALAVTDPERARKDFSLLTHYYQRSWIMRKLLYAIPVKARGDIYRFLRHRIPDFLARYGYYLHPVANLAGKGIPGYPQGMLSPFIVPHEKERKRAAVYDRVLSAAGRLSPMKNVDREIADIKNRVLAGTI